MSREDQMQYLEEPQTLRNKDYITIKRWEYDHLKSIQVGYRASDELIKRLKIKEIELNKREQELKKKEMQIKYALHKKILDFAKQFLSAND
jgi:hypothetical protein